MLTADEAERARFSATRFKAGYEMREVDDFLDRVVEQLRYYEQGGRPGAPADPGLRSSSSSQASADPRAPHELDDRPDTLG